MAFKAAFSSSTTKKLLLAPNAISVATKYFSGISISLPIVLWIPWSLGLFKIFRTDTGADSALNILFSKIWILFSSKNLALLVSIKVLLAVLFLTFKTSKLFFTSSPLLLSEFILFSISKTSLSQRVIFLFNSSSFSLSLIKLFSRTSLFASYFCLSIVSFFSPFRSLKFSVTFKSSSFFLFKFSSSSKLLNLSVSNLLSSVLSFKVSNFSFKFLISSVILVYSRFKSVISFAIKAISILSSSSFIFKYFLATILCSFKGSTVVASSSITSLIRIKFSSVFSSFLSDSSLRFLYFKTPAALSKITLRSLDFELTISVTFPWLMILKALVPAPESINKSVTSLSLTLVLFIKYSFSPVE